MYKLSYYRFAEASSMVTGRYGFDRVRNTIIGKTDISLQYFEEVFTSEHWMVRIYRVLDRYGSLATFVSVLLYIMLSQWLVKFVLWMHHSIADLWKQLMLHAK